MHSAYMSIGRVVITIFQPTDLATSYYFVFWGADSESDLKSISFEKNARTCDYLFSFDDVWKVQKAECENHIKWKPNTG